LTRNVLLKMPPRRHLRSFFGKPLQTKLPFEARLLVACIAFARASESRQVPRSTRDHAAEPRCSAAEAGFCIMTKPADFFDSRCGCHVVVVVVVVAFSGITDCCPHLETL
jgi:hypothetical protein